MTMSLTAGAGEPRGPKVVEYRKDLSCPSFCVFPCSDENGDPSLPLTICCCCCLPKISTIGPTGQQLGRSEYICETESCGCVPAFNVYDGQGQHRYFGEERTTPRVPPSAHTLHR